MKGAGRVVFVAVLLLIVGTLNILYGIGAVAVVNQSGELVGFLRRGRLKRKG